ncbi:MAG: hypothetical protein JW395_3365 [Nitrospira sp.]|nr:hypothetical protein [Nitrospira sp.]
MFGELPDRDLEQVELVSVKGVEAAKFIAAAPASQVNRVIAEAVKRLEVVLFAVVDVGEDFRLLHSFCQEPFLNDLLHISTGEREFGLKPTFDFSDVLSCHSFEGAENVFEISLRRYEYPSPAVADGAQGFRHGL